MKLWNNKSGFTQHHILNNIKSSVGFTLIEMLIAVSIFALVLIMATNIYIIINNSQRKVVTLQKIQEDVRFLFEAMAQDIRLSSINYSFYQDPANAINLHPEFGGDDNSVLALIDQSGNQIYYRLNVNKLQYCSGGCDFDDPLVWANITPESVEIIDLGVVITPGANPFEEVNQDLCNFNADCEIGYMCNLTAVPLSRCEYFNDGGNFQPKVIFSIYSRGVGRNIAEESELNMQSIISTRIFSGQVLNLNHE